MATTTSASSQCVVFTVEVFLLIYKLFCGFATTHFYIARYLQYGISSHVDR